jgi:hypothetical protein
MCVSVRTTIGETCIRIDLIKSNNNMNLDHKTQSDQYLGIEYLAKESHESIDNVSLLYGKELEKLSMDARIKTFIPIFALRNVREILDQRPNSLPLKVLHT